MSITILQYVLIATLVLGGGYFFYLLKENCADMDENYYGINFSVLDTLQGKEVTPESVKNILRIVSENVSFIETNSNKLSNEQKEESALFAIKDDLARLNLQYPLSDTSIKYLIRLCCGLNNPH